MIKIKPLLASGFLALLSLQAAEEYSPVTTFEENGVVCFRTSLKQATQPEHISRLHALAKKAGNDITFEELATNYTRERDKEEKDLKSFGVTHEQIFPLGEYIFQKGEEYIAKVIVSAPQEVDVEVQFKVSARLSGGIITLNINDTARLEEIKAALERGEMPEEFSPIPSINLGDSGIGGTLFKFQKTGPEVINLNTRAVREAGKPKDSILFNLSFVSTLTKEEESSLYRSFFEKVLTPHIGRPCNLAVTTTLNGEIVSYELSRDPFRGIYAFVDQDERNSLLPLGFEVYNTFPMTKVEGDSKEDTPKVCHMAWIK